MCSINLYIAAFDEDLRDEDVETKSGIDAEDDFRDMVEDGTDASILRGEREQIEQVTCSLLSVYLTKIEAYKKTIKCG